MSRLTQEQSITNEIEQPQNLQTVTSLSPALNIRQQQITANRQANLRKAREALKKKKDEELRRQVTDLLSEKSLGTSYSVPNTPTQEVKVEDNVTDSGESISGIIKTALTTIFVSTASFALSYAVSQFFESIRDSTQVSNTVPNIQKIHIEAPLNSTIHGEEKKEPGNSIPMYRGQPIFR